MNEAFPSRLDAISALSLAGEHHAFEHHVINGNPCRVMANAPKTLRDLLEHSQQYTTLNYLVYQGEQLSYADAYRQVAKLANTLRQDYQVKKGDRVAIGMRNYPEWPIAFWAITSIGGIAVALNALWTSEELAYALKLTDTHLVVADRERVERLLPVASKLHCQILSVRCDDMSSDNLRPLYQAMDAKSETLPPIDIAPDDDALIFFTSGSTGYPKGAVSSHRAAIHATMSWDMDLSIMCYRFNIERPDEPWGTRFKFLVAVPLFHVSGSHVAMISTLYRGRENHLMYKWDVMEALDTIEAEQITHFLAVPSMTGDLVKAADKHSRSLASLMQVGGGGSARSSRQVRDIDRVFKNASPGTGWGMTETNAIGTSIVGHDYLRYPLSSGQCSAFLDMQVLNDEDEVLAAGETGHLVIRGTSMFREYWNRPDANAEAFVDGWFRTGDIAYINEEGFLFIVDRAKDIVIRGGENIGCGEVEDAIYTHPLVNEVIVFGLPHERLGEEVACMVYSGSSLTDIELTQYLSVHLAKFQIPSRMFFTSEALPRIASGKFNKRGVRQQMLARLGLSDD